METGIFVFQTNRQKIMSTMPQKALVLNRFSTRLAEWLAHGSSRMIWLSNWETYPPDQFILFGKIRVGCGENRPPIEAPGHLFESSTEEEIATMAGLMFLVMAFHWEAYVVVKNSGDCIFLGDQHIVLLSGADAKLKEASKLIADFKLKVITDIREAWE